jgi:stage V sporulation protein SpoVS
MRAPFKVKEDGDMSRPRDGEIWVRTTDDVHKLAADLLDMLEDKPVVNDVRFVDLACIGAGCLNQGIKAIAVARERIERHGTDLTVQPYFSSFVDDEGRNRTRMVLRVTEIEYATE